MWLGGGGHTEALLKAGARVIGLDQDPDALEFAGARLESFGELFTPVRSSFGRVREVLDDLGIADRPPRMDDRANTRLCGCIHAVPEREERV